MDNEQEERRNTLGYSVENINEGLIESMLSNLASRLGRINREVREDEQIQRIFRSLTRRLNIRNNDNNQSTNLVNNDNQSTNSIDNEIQSTNLINNDNNQSTNLVNNEIQSTNLVNNDNQMNNQVNNNQINNGTNLVIFDLIFNGSNISLEFERSQSFTETILFFENLLSMRDTKVKMQKEQINKLRRFRVTQKMTKEECSICMNKYKLREMARELSCDHIFHSKCVDRWLMKHSNTCPVCRKETSV